MHRNRFSSQIPNRRSMRLLAAALSVLILASGCSLSTKKSGKPGSLARGASLKGAHITVGSKEFTEQEILCQITSQALRSAGAEVTEKCGLSGSNTVRTALTSGRLDLYWEYTGTAWISYLNHTAPITDPTQQYHAVAEQDLAKNQIVWLNPAPLNNTYALAAKTSVAQQLGVTSLSDYAKLVHAYPSKASMCVASEFTARNDGLPGLEKAYGFTAAARDLATLAEGAIYNSISKKNPCNFGEVFTTDGRIKGLGLTVLTDDKHFFPVYNAAVSVRKSVLAANPNLAKVLNPIAAALDTSTMQKLNADVDINGMQSSDAAHHWLQSKGFIG